MTVTYATDEQVIEHFAPAEDLLFPADKVDEPTFDRHRMIVKMVIDSSLGKRQPPASGLANDETAHVECLGVIAMALRENASVSNEGTDIFWGQAKEYQRQFETALENLRAPASDDEDTMADEAGGNAIPFERC